MSSRDPKQLHHELYAIYLNFEKRMKLAGIDYILTCTFRSNAEQKALYEQGRNGDKRPIVTNAMPGQSAHNVCVGSYPCAMAFDIVIMENGKPDWNASNPKWKKAGEIGRSLGLTWAGDWKTFKEFPHFELTNWKDIVNV